MTEDQGKAIIRRLESVERTLNLIYKDRDLLEQISLRVGTLEDRVNQLASRVQSLEKNTKADLQDVLLEVQDTKDQLEKVVSDE